MQKITIKTRKSAAIEEWKAKEEGSFDDHDRAPDHVYALLNRFGGKATFTIDEAKTLIRSGSYQSTSWEPDEIAGGNRTMKTIANYVDRLQRATKNHMPPIEFVNQ